MKKIKTIFADIAEQRKNKKQYELIKRLMEQGKFADWIYKKYL